MFVIHIGAWSPGKPIVECMPINLRVEFRVRNKHSISPTLLATLRGTNKLLYILCIISFAGVWSFVFPSDVSIDTCGLSVVSNYMCDVKCFMFLSLASTLLMII